MHDSELTRVSVNSSSIASVGYADDTATLEVEFRSGSVYRYFAVARSVFDRFLESPSKGAHFARFIRGRYPFARTKEAPKPSGPSPEGRPDQR